LAKSMINSEKTALAEPEKLMRIKLGWPATLREPSFLAKPVVLRPYRVADAQAWCEIRVRNAQWLRRWEMTKPKSPSYPSSLKSYLAMVAVMRREALLGHALSWAVTFGGELVGHASLGGIVWGSERIGVLGVWVDEKFVRHGIGSITTAMVVDHGFHDVGLHRIVANIRPENMVARQGIEKYFREEGLLVRQSYVDGAWRDHLCYALTAEEVPAGGYVALFRSAAAASKPGG
jgi:ribosomal-protein-alanine N-acetyltransferase